MNIKTKLILGIGMLAGMIILLVTLSVVNLQLLTATEPDSPAAMPALERALSERTFKVRMSPELPITPATFFIYSS